MNILFYCNGFPNPQLGGIQSSTCTLASGFIALGHSCYCSYFEDEPIKIASISESLFLSLTQQKKNELQKMIIEKDIHIIINQSLHILANVDFLYQTVSEINKPCKIYTVYHNRPGIKIYKSTIPLVSIKNLMKRFFFPLYCWYTNFSEEKSIKKALSFSNALVLLSQRYKDDFIKNYHIETFLQGKITAVPNASHYNNVGNVNFDEKRREVLIVARFDENQKRISLAIKIWKMIEANTKSNDWVLRIIGHGPCATDYINLVKELGIKRIIFEGKKDALKYYQYASIFMMTSAYEGWPMTVIEAMQNGVVPIVFNSYSAVYDILTDEEDGIKSENNDIKNYADRLAALMEDNVLREKMAKNAITKVQNFCVDKIVEQWLTVFNNF